MDAITPRRRRTLRSRTLLATAAVLAALPGSASAAGADEAQAAPIQVTATLGSCSEHRSCQIEVAFDAVPGADSYEAVIRGPDGNELVSAAAQPGTNSYSVAYRGNGTYLVRITAFGDLPAPAALPR